MISDRPYLRGDYRMERTSFLVWLLSATIAGFIVQNVIGLWFESSAFDRLFALSVPAVKQGSFWTVLTYPLLHRNVLHLFLVMFGVFFLGRELLPIVGERRLLGLTIAAVATGACGWLLENLRQGDSAGSLVGAAPILLCYLIVYAGLFPNREISFLFFFVIPVNTRPKHIAWLTLGIELGGALLTEIGSGKYQTGFPHSAHLGAMFAGWCYFRYFHDADRIWFAHRASDHMRQWLGRRTPQTLEAKPLSESSPKPPAPAKSTAELRAQVDGILDKINSHGFNALSEEERRVLEMAKQVLGRR